MERIKTVIGSSDTDLVTAVRAAEAGAEAFVRGLAPGISASVFKVETLPYKDGGAIHIITFVVREG